MFRFSDLILLIVIFSSMLAGILMPGPAAVFQPYPLYLMMVLLFLSFLSIELNDIWSTIRNHLGSVIWLCALKLILLPLGVYALFSVLFPSYAVAALLLTAVSTGVVAPFISSLVGGLSPLVLVMVVVSSLIVPFTLPALVDILLGRSIEISLYGMMRMLCLTIFIPILAVEILRRLSPGLAQAILNRRHPISLVIFAVINLGVFSKYAGFFKQNPITILEASLVAVGLGGTYLIAGLLALFKGPAESRIASAISLGNINNILVIVFASEFFGPLEPFVAAMYMIPFFGIIFPLRLYHRLGVDDS